MGSSHAVTAIATAVLVGAGVVVGALVFGGHEDRAPVAAAPTQAPEETTPRQPALGGASDADSEEVLRLARRVVELEAALGAVRDDLAAARAELRPLLELYEKFKDTLPEGGADGAVTTMEEGFVVAEDDTSPENLARSLGLSGQRLAGFTGQVGKIMDEVKALEKRHAEVSVKDGVTTIKIPRYPAEAERLERMWDDWVSANLTSDEQKKYEKAQTKNLLFLNRLGFQDRTVTIREAAGAVKLVDHSKTKDGQEFETITSGPAAARSMVLADYLHMLD